MTPIYMLPNYGDLLLSLQEKGISKESSLQKISSLIEKRNEISSKYEEFKDKLIWDEEWGEAYEVGEWMIDEMDKLTEQILVYRILSGEENVLENYKFNDAGYTQRGYLDENGQFHDY